MDLSIPLDGGWHRMATTTRRSCIRTTSIAACPLAILAPRTAVASASHAAFAMAVGSLALTGVATVELADVGLPREMADGVAGLVAQRQRRRPSGTTRADWVTDGDIVRPAGECARRGARCPGSP